MSAPTESENLYEILGIDRATAQADISLAYFRQVRAYPPREHPEFFQRLNAAYQVLADATRRAAYDQETENGRRVRVLVDQAAVAAERDPQKAMNLLKNAVILAPDMSRPRALLAHVSMRIQDYVAAERQYRWLLRHGPTDEVLHFRLACALWQQGKLDDAESELDEALRLNSHHHDSLALRSRLSAARDDIEGQVDALERAIANDDTENFADFDALLQLLLLYDRTGNAPESTRTRARLLAVLPPSKASSVASDLLRRAQDLLDNGDTAPGKALLTLASGISLPDEEQETAQAIAHALRRMELAHEARPLPQDALLTGGLKSCFTVLYLDRSKEIIRQSRMDSAFALIQREIEEDSRGLIQRIDYLWREYPNLAADQEIFLNQLRSRTVRRQEMRAAATLSVAPSDPVAPVTTPDPPRKQGLFSRLLGGSS